MKRQKGVDRRMKLNRTTQRTIEILELISQKPEGASLDELCDRLELPKTSAYDIVTTLEALGMVQISWGQKKRYTIGLTAYRIGINYTNNLNIMNIMEPELKKFAHEIGKTVFFGVRSDIEVVYICKFEPENPIITTATVGSRIPMYCTSLGKAILAYSEPEILQPLLKRMTFVKRTEHDHGSGPAYAGTYAGAGAGICAGCPRDGGACRVRECTGVWGRWWPGGGSQCFNIVPGSRQL